MNNQYYVCLPWQKQPHLLDPFNIDPEIIKAAPDCLYFGRVIAKIEQFSELVNLTFYLTWDLEKLPSYGKYVIAIVLGDEHCRVPRYVYQVGAIFKSHGTKLHFEFSVFRPFSFLNWLTLFQFTKITLFNSLFQLQSWFYNNKYRSRPAPIYDIPLGYFNQRDLPIIHISKRLYDMSFIGSINQESGIQRWLGSFTSSPKIFSRRKLLRSIEYIRQQDHQIQIYSSETPNFLYGLNDTGNLYSQIMQNTKLYLVPRGTSIETFRLFEAWRYGCIPIVETLPKRWFYDGSPVIKLESWKELGNIVTDLELGKIDLNAMHEASLVWWQEKCSELAIGKYIRDQLVQVLEDFEKGGEGRVSASQTLLTQ